MSQYFRKINYYETDKMGVTHHSNYVRFMEEARIDFLSQIGCGYEKWEEDGIVSPVTAIECEYKRPTTFGDEICVEVSIAEYKRLTLTVAYKMTNTKTGETVFVGKSHHCFLGADGRLVALSRQAPGYDEILKAHLSEYEQ